jgi:hypothetical protein
MDHASSSRTIPELDSFVTFSIGSTSQVTRDDSFHINHIKTSPSLSLIYPELIDWSIQNQKPEIRSFQNDYEITCYLNAIEPVISSTSKPAVNMTKSDIKYLSQKIKRKNKRSDGENHIVAVSNPQKSKNKGVSNGENLSEAPADEVLGSLPSYFQDRSLVLVEPTQPINLGT